MLRDTTWVDLVPNTTRNSLCIKSTPRRSLARVKRRTSTAANIPSPHAEVTLHERYDAIPGPVTWRRMTRARGHRIYPPPIL